MPYEIVTFDCYGTLIDWETGITRAFRAALGGEAPGDAAILAAHDEVEPAIQARGYASYRAVLTECAERMASKLGARLPPERAGCLADSLPTWPPFPDTVPALERLVAAGYELGILSNVDDDLLAGTRKLLEVEFSLVVTAEQVRSYKPAPGHFVEARRRIGARPWLHAARSKFHDIAPCRALGIDSAWIRRRDKDGTAPEGARTFDDLAALADWMTTG